MQNNVVDTSGRENKRLMFTDTEKVLITTMSKKVVGTKRKTTRMIEMVVGGTRQIL